MRETDMVCVEREREREIHTHRQRESEKKLPFQASNLNPLYTLETSPIDSRDVLPRPITLMFPLQIIRFDVIFV